MNYIVSTQYDGFNRKLYETNCTQCQKIVYRPKHLLDKRKIFCSKECSYSYQARDRIMCLCSLCGINFKRPISKTKIAKSGLQFCSRKCKDTAQQIGGIEAIQPDHYTNEPSIFSYRVYALRHHGKKCQKCSYDQFVDMLDVHHKDGNRDNNTLENLEVLCVWCHAIETRKVAQHSWNGKLE